MSTLLCAMALVLEMDAGGSSLNEQPSQFHDLCGASETSISISQNGSHVVHIGGIFSFSRGHPGALFLLTNIMEELGFEELVHFIGHGVDGVVREVWSGVIGGTGRGAALPARNVHTLQVLGDVDHLDGVKGSKSVDEGAGIEVGPQSVVKLGCHL